VVEPTKVRLLRQAIRLAGMEQVSKQLRASRETLDLWLRGLAPMPDRKLLPLADLLDRLRPEQIPPPGTPSDYGADQQRKPSPGEEDI
jgi:hypothetical protein